MFIYYSLLVCCVVLAMSLICHLCFAIYMYFMQMIVYSVYIWLQKKKRKEKKTKKTVCVYILALFEFQKIFPWLRLLLNNLLLSIYVYNLCCCFTSWCYFSTIYILVIFYMYFWNVSEINIINKHALVTDNFRKQNWKKLFLRIWRKWLKLTNVKSTVKR